MKVLFVALAMSALVGCSAGTPSDGSNVKDTGAEGLAHTTLELNSYGESILVDARNGDRVSMQAFDSGFNYSSDDLSIDASEEHATVLTPKNAPTCFHGPESGVCSIVASLSKEAHKAYVEGDHDLTSLKSCAIENNGVRIAYTMTTDYDSYEISAETLIPACAK